MHAHSTPYVLYADGAGNVFEDESLYAVGRSGYYADRIPDTDWIPLPEGGNLYELIGRRPVGIDVKTGEMRPSDKGWAVAAFIPPAYTGLYLAAYLNTAEAPTLPLFCYTAVGFRNGAFVVPAVRIEQDIRQESDGFDIERVNFGIAHMLQQYPNNRLIEHLANHCTLTYTCPAARNYFMRRWECPVPTSPACNSNCIGCISFQPESETIVSSHDRLNFKPTAGEIVEYTVDHLERAPYPIVSFGQGCEGEPLLMWETIAEAIRQIRRFTDKGSININTNGSMPQAVRKLCEAGLNSIRVSTNSVQEWLYDAYYLPNNYQFADIIESLRVVREFNGWTSINYFVFPGLTDSEEEYQALREVIRSTGLKMIQWRNFSIDPDWYLEKVGVADTDLAMGVGTLMKRLSAEFPSLRFGYFNPPIERIRGDYQKDFAHH